MLMLCMCWQSLVYAGMGVTLAQAEDTAHALLHFEGAAHHHEHDGDAHDSFHQDDSSASVQHALADVGVFAPALMGFAPALELLETASTPPDGLSVELAGPALLGLERPPKTIS